jgi:acyl-coenzyme A thioesterase PaaI-like protein
MHGGALASLVDLVGSAVFFAGGSPATGVSLEITISYLNAARANVREDNEDPHLNYIDSAWSI